MVIHKGTVDRSNVDVHRCINSVLLNSMTRGQGGAKILKESTNLQELKRE